MTMAYYLCENSGDVENRKLMNVQSEKNNTIQVDLNIQ